VRDVPEQRASTMDDLTPGQEEAAATVGAIQRIAMAL
jgi:hypothetical protein